MKLTFVFTASFIFVSNIYAQSSGCDHCPKPIVDLYGVRMDVRMPTDSSGKVTNLLQPAFLNWLALGDSQIPVANIKNNDPEKDCVDWLDGTMAQEFLANPDTVLKAHLENYSAGDLPANGPVPGIDYLIWASLDSSGGQYHFHVYLEDAYSRTRIAAGEADFTDPNNAQTAAQNAAAQIEPVFDKVRTYQKNIRNLGGNDVAINAKVYVIPSKGDMKGSEIIPVEFQVKDCDGTPLSNRWVKISATNGHFDKDSIETDGNGNAAANFTSDNVSDIADITGIYFPYFTVSHKRKGAWGDTTVNINYVPLRNWIVNIKENLLSSDISSDNYNGTVSYSSTTLSSEAAVTQYVQGDFEDSSITIDNIIGGKGYSNAKGVETGYSQSNTLYSTGTITTNATVSPSEDFTYSIGLDDFIQYGQYNGIGFTSSLLLDETQNWYQFMAGSAVSPSPWSSDTTIFITEVPDVYQDFTVGPNDVNGGNNATWQRTDSGFIFKGNFLFDSTITESNDPSYKEFYHEEQHVTAYVRPYFNPTSVKPAYDNTAVPEKFALFQNYPNPFNPTTKIRYSIPYVGTHRNASVHLDVYDILGREIAVLVNKKQRPGNYEVTFDGSSLPSGVYIYRLIAGSYNKTKKLILLK